MAGSGALLPGCEIGLLFVGEPVDGRQFEADELLNDLHRYFMDLIPKRFAVGQ